jgi:uncharacterized protein (TIGR03663 family)
MPPVQQGDPSNEDRAGARAFRALIGLSTISLLLRLFGLGGRIFHWDEGRVGYWILRYHETGEFAYRPIIHGPFIQHVDALLFHVVPATDFWARFPIAVITAALPLTAWLFRRHLDDRETVVLGLLLTVQPLLLYYSRFMRSDPLVGAFAFASFALLVRAYDTRRLVPAFAAVASMALAFASKENALLYVACIGGAAAVCYDHRLVRGAMGGDPSTGVDAGSAVDADSSLASRVRADLGATRNWLTERSGAVPYPIWASGVLAGLAATFLAITVVMYAPRPEAWNALSSLSGLIDVTLAATVDTADQLTDVWLDRDGGDRSYFAFFHDILETLAFGAPVVLGLTLAGYLTDGFGVDGTPPRRRALVSFTLYWAAASVIGYPIATDIQAPWAAYHIVLPLTIPAAVGAASLVGVVERSLTIGDETLTEGLRRIADEGAPSADLTVPVLLAALLLTAGVVGVVGLNVDYWNSSAEEDKQVLQWAQPSNDLKPTMADVEAIAAENEGTDVLFYGTSAGGVTQFHVADESSLQQPPPGGPAWHSRLPLPWYLERADADVTSTAPSTPPAEALADAPPVVIAHDDARAEVEAELDGYEARQHPFKLWGEEIVVFLDRDALAAVGS